MASRTGQQAAAAPEPEVIRVLVAEDMRILRDTLVAVLNLEPDIEVIGQVADGTAIVPAAERLSRTLRWLISTCPASTG